MDAAIAAGFADQLVDDDPLVRVRVATALAPAPLLGRTGLVEDEGGDARRLAQAPLHGIELVAVMHAHARCEAGTERVLRRLVGDDRDLLDPSDSRRRVIAATSRLPVSIFWPPVMATAPLKRILKVMLAPDATAARTASEPEW